MHKFPNFGARPAGGFTLIELMVVVLIVTILTIIAVPSYRNQTLKSRRTEIKSILLDLAAREERFMATNGVYSSSITDLGFSVAWGSPVGSKYYTIATPTVAGAQASSATVAAIPATFLIQATVYGDQANDRQCKTFSIDQSGAQTSTNSTDAPSTGCW
jgi:type IV pilus assembly protein PilE